MRRWKVFAMGGLSDLPQGHKFRRTIKLQHSLRFTFRLSAGGILKAGTSTGCIQTGCSKAHSWAELPLPLPLLSMSLLCLPFPFPGQGITLPHPRLLLPPPRHSGSSWCFLQFVLWTGFKTELGKMWKHLQMKPAGTHAFHSFSRKRLARD